MQYILEHYYLEKHRNHCIIVEMDNTVEEVIEICSSLMFLLEDSVDIYAELDDMCLLSCLEKFYGANDVKERFLNMYKKELPLPIRTTYQEICIGAEADSIAYIIDLSEAREVCCGMGYKQIMEKWLPKVEQLSQIKKIVQFENPDSVCAVIRKYIDEKYPDIKDGLSVAVDLTRKIVINCNGIIVGITLDALLTGSSGYDSYEDSFFRNLEDVVNGMVVSVKKSIA